MISKDSIPEMISVPELPNFDAEWEKHQKKDVLFRNVAKTKNAYAAFVAANPTIEDQKSELKQLESSIEALVTDLGLLESERSRLAAISEDLEDGLFRAIKLDEDELAMFVDGTLLKEDDFMNIDLLEAKLKSSQQLVSFLQQRIQLVRHDTITTAKLDQERELRKSLEEQTYGIKRYEEEISRLQESCAAAEQDWLDAFSPTPNAARAGIDMLETSEAQDTTSLSSGQESLADDLLIIDYIMYDFRSQQSENSGQLAEVAASGSYEHSAIKLATSHPQSSLVHLSKAGYAIRNRVLEKSKARGTQIETVIDQGNLAAHQGDPLADALLFTPAVEKLTGMPYRRDISTYVAMYGFSPGLIAKNSHCKTFVEMLKLRFGMRTMSAAYSQAYPTKSELADFKQLLGDITVKNASGIPEDYEKYLTGDNEGKKHMANMRALFNTVWKEYKRLPWTR